jgi:hypothetical protein
MGRERKPMHLRQKAYFEQRLKDRMSDLAGRGIAPERAAKDPIARKLKADIKAVDYRLRKIAESEKITADLARLKAERAAAPEKKPEAKGEKPRKAAEGGKEKKPKAEKKPAPPEATEGGQNSPTAEKPQKAHKP